MKVMVSYGRTNKAFSFMRQLYQMFQKIGNTKRPPYGMLMQIWYNTRINMCKEKPMVSAAKEPQVRYSAAYPTGAERV